MSLISNKKRNTVFFGLIVLGIVMVVLGLLPFPNIMLPPVITGIGFWLLAWGVK